jgi:hypothetical protein
MQGQLSRNYVMAKHSSRDVGADLQLQVLQFTAKPSPAIVRKHDELIGKCRGLQATVRLAMLLSHLDQTCQGILNQALRCIPERLAMMYVPQYCRNA